jgi:hypothetical protein
MVKSNIDVGLAMADIRDKYEDHGIMHSSLSGPNPIWDKVE